MKIANEILNILAECNVDGKVVFLPGEQLDRKTYEAVNKCLTSIGGKWNRSAKGHVFDYEPAEALENLVFTGETEDMKKKFQFFPTPRPIAEMMCDMAELDTYSKVLEPECGRGDLMDAIYDRGVEDLFGVELNRDMDKYLKEKPYTTITGVDFVSDFAEDENIRCDWTHIIMNPPFSKQQDVRHIRAAYGILPPGGILVSIVSPSPFFRTNKTSVDFRNWLNEVNAEIVEIPEGAFKGSGTMVRTNIVKIRK
jgi:phospholipid N-methyltransferase